MAFTQRQYAFCREAIAHRRELREMPKRGYYRHEPTSHSCSHEIFNRVRQRGERIIEVVIGKDGSTLWLRIGTTPARDEGRGI